MVITIPSSDDGVLPQTYISVEGFKVLLTITPLQLIKLYIKKLNVGLLNVILWHELGVGVGVGVIVGVIVGVGVGGHAAY